MKKLIALIMAVCMALSLAMPIFAANYSEPVTLGLYVKGDPDDQVVVTSSGTYTLAFESESASSYDWIVLKNVAGADQATSIPQGTEINVTELLIDGISHTFDGGKSTYNYVVGENGAIELLVYLGPWGINHIDNNPYSASKVEMTFEIVENEEPEDEIAVVEFDFEDGTTSGWSHHWGNNNLSNDNGVLVTDRGENNIFYTTGVTINKTLTKGYTYKFSAEVGYNDEEAPDTTKITFALKSGNFDGEEYLDHSVTATKNKMTKFEVTFTPPADITDACLCFNYKATGWGNYSPADIRIDNVKITIAYIPVYTGDLNSDGNIDKSDALYLLYHSIFGETMYPVNQDVDFNRDGNVDGGDAIYLLYHSLFADLYPLFTPAEYMQYVRENMSEKEAAGSTTQYQSVSYPTYEYIRYYSTTCERERGFNIMLPANYDENKEYPVLYALHGYWGDEHSLLDETGYAPIMFKQIVGNAVANGDAEEMIIVFPYIYASKDREFIEGGIDGTNNAAYDNFVNDLFNDLMPFVEANYPVKTGRENTAITGFSMGGRESIYIGLTHSDTFGYVGAVCPAPGVDSDLLPPSQMKFKYDDPYLFFLTAGSNDGVVGDTPSYYHGIFEDNDVDHVWHYVNGGTHDGVSIRAHVYNFVRYIFKYK